MASVEILLAGEIRDGILSFSGMAVSIASLSRWIKMMTDEDSLPK